MWLEALQDCQSPESKHLVILTRDNSKKDWVYKPERVLDEDGKLQQNGGLVTLPLPLLVQEAKQRCPSLESVHVISLEMFTQILRSGFRARVGNLVRALQPTPKTTRPAQRPDRQVEPPPGAPAALNVTFSSQDMIYEPAPEEADSPVWRQIAGLRAEGWSVQNEAAETLMGIIGEATDEQMKQIGRGIIAASNEDAVGPIDLANAVLDNRELPAAARANLLVGLLAETYFDENGSAKKPAAFPDITTILFARAQDPETRRAYEVTIEEPLDPFRQSYLALPGEPDRQIILEIKISQSGLTAQADGVELLEANAPENRRITIGGRTGETSVSDLVAAIAREFVVPVSMLQVEGPTNFQVDIPERMGFIAWGPSTGEHLR
jgi:hypothetical protein